jgi:hypothetical protein
VDDTHPEVRRLLTEGYRRMSPAEKLALVRSLTIGAQQLATMIRAFDWDPEEHGRG